MTPWSFMNAVRRLNAWDDGKGEPVFNILISWEKNVAWVACVQNLFALSKSTGEMDIGGEPDICCSRETILKQMTVRRNNLLRDEYLWMRSQW